MRRAAVYGAAFAALAVAAALGLTRDIDRAITDALQSAGSYPLDVAASLVTSLERIELTALAAVALAIWWWRREGTLGLVPLLLFTGTLIEIVLKYALPHAPPPGELSRAIEILPGLHADTPYGFPSGHAERAAFLAALLSVRWPRWAWPLGVAAALVVLTRVYLGQHWASDALGGALLGLALAELGMALRRR